MADEKAIGQIRDRDRGITSGAFASEVLAHFLTDWPGCPDWATMTKVQRRMAISKSFAGDVFYAWIQLRRAAFSEVCTVDLRCGVCRKPSALDVELGTVEVICPDEENPVRRTYNLKHGFTYRSDKVLSVTMDPPRWAVFEKIANTANTGKIKSAVLAGCIVGINGAELASPIPEGSLELTKADLEMLVAATDRDPPGPDLSVEEWCPHCGTLIAQSLPWMYDSFFSQSRSGAGGA